MRKNFEIVEHFCQFTGMQINVKKSAAFFIKSYVGSFTMNYMKAFMIGRLQIL